MRYIYIYIYIIDIHVYIYVYIYIYTFSSGCIPGFHEGATDQAHGGGQDLRLAAPGRFGDSNSALRNFGDRREEPENCWGIETWAGGFLDSQVVAIAFFSHCCDRCSGFLWVEKQQAKIAILVGLFFWGWTPKLARRKGFSFFF